jgi:hypothetical protein
VAGRDHLVYEIEVGDGAGVRELVYVDAHTGKVVDRITGIHDAMHRTVHEPDFNNVVIWDEGDALPYSTGDAVNDDQVNGLIDYAADVYDLYANLSGGTYLSWDGRDGTMHTVWNASFIPCPNATWNGSSTNYCNGVASDDVAAHEWAHAYTQQTHGLIYQWQPGALNEAYSDMFGEVVDLLNGAGTDAPDMTRGVETCSTFGGGVLAGLFVNAPVGIVGSYAAAGAGFNPGPPISATANVQLVDDGNDEGGAASVTDGCQPLIGFTPGNIAMIDRGDCGFTIKVVNAQNAGASGVIIVNYDSSTFNMGGNDGSVTIPSVMIGSDDGDLIKGQLGIGVNATISLEAPEDNSLRWLMGEDSFSFGSPIRDMWHPVCMGDPGKVSDAEYWCSTGDGGGVHTNSVVPNHAFALLFDGGSYNGRGISGLGLTKTVHLYWRAMETYQVPDTDFADHADALSQSCFDLIGVNLPDLLTGQPSGEVLDFFDCVDVTDATLAVELTADPPCDFQPLLQSPAPPFACDAISFLDDFEIDPTASWTRTNVGVFAEYLPRNWEWTSDVPAGGSGFAFFALDDIDLGNCIEGDDDQSGVMTLDSPPIVLADQASLIFDHYVATETDYDGGNLKLSVNGGPFQIVAAGDFTFNPYPGSLTGGGNTNPLAGDPAFHGSDGGEVHGTWGQSQIDLAGLAAPGDTIRLRFDFGVDGCNGLEGWYVDNVVVCSTLPAAGHVPDGADYPGTPLTVDKAGTDIVLAWGASCVGVDSDYAVYEGALGAFAGHAPATCSTGGGTSHTMAPAPGGTYYLVVPRNGTHEGSYGLDGAGAERPQGLAACLDQAIAVQCD